MTIDWSYPAAAIVGASLSVTGASLQSVLRNPLAEPYLMGTVGGAALFVALAFVSGLTALGAWVMPTASFLGSLLSLALVCLVAALAARNRDGASPLILSSSSTLVLAGFVVGAFTGSMNMLVLSYAKADDFTVVSKWLYGNLAAVTPLAFALAFLAFALVFTVLLALARYLDVLELGRAEAECLGVNARALLLVVLVLSSLMTAVSVALAGAIGFVGLVVPHIVRRKVGPKMRRVLPSAALLGALALVGAQALARALPGDVPVGVIAAICGAPVIFLILVSRRSGEGWDV